MLTDGVSTGWSGLHLFLNQTCRTLTMVVNRQGLKDNQSVETRATYLSVSRVHELRWAGIVDKSGIPCPGILL
jgi:hypothetical protein